MQAEQVNSQPVLLPQTAHRKLSPVKQQAADSYLVLFIAASSLTVILVRIFLQLTGYPQVGDTTFHVAHVLWGGLLLFLSILLTLVWANNWVLWAVALLGGIGTGLFIDEVGKFITQSNDYFFPLAFPIIYGFVVVCVWLYLRVRRSQPRDTRTLLYHIVGDLKQVIDNDLDPFEYSILVGELNQALAGANNPNERNLARALLEFVKTRDLELAREPNAIERAWGWTKFVAARWPSRRVFRALLLAGLGMATVSAALKLGALLVLRAETLQQFAVTLSSFVIVSGKSQYEVNHPVLFTIHMGGIALTGLMAGLAGALLLLGWERPALRLGTLGLALSLTVVNLLTFYFSQLYALSDAVGQLILLLGITIYRWRFYLNK